MRANHSSAGSFFLLAETRQQRGDLHDSRQHLEGLVFGLVVVANRLLDGGREFPAARHFGAQFRMIEAQGGAFGLDQAIFACLRALPQGGKTLVIAHVQHHDANIVQQAGGECHFAILAQAFRHGSGVSGGGQAALPVLIAIDAGRGLAVEKAPMNPADSTRLRTVLKPSTTTAS